MKKRLIQIALILGLMTLTCVAAQASETGAPTSGFRVVEVESAYESDVTLTPVDDKGANVTKADVRFPGAVKMKVTYSKAQSGNEYLLCVLADDETGVPTVDNMAYIDQKTADGATMEFTVFPKAVDAKTTSVKYTVYLSSNADASSEDAGLTSFTKVGAFEYYAAGNSDVMLGDVDGDEDVTISDAVLVLQAIVEAETLDDKQTAAADVDKDTEVTISDAVAILQYIVEAITSFDEL